MVHADDAPIDPAVLYDTYAGHAYSLAVCIVQDRRLAQEVVQEVFLAMVSDTSGFDGDRVGFSSWLLALTHHNAVDVLRRGQVRPHHAAGIHPVTGAPGQARDDSEHAPEQVGDRVRNPRLRRALAELPPSQRQALLLAYFEGYSQGEVAAVTGSPLSTVKTDMYHGMRRLHALLHEIG